MNFLVQVDELPASAKIAHSIMAYDRVTDELALELPIPLIMDTLVLKVARVPTLDANGALSYPLEARAIETLRFLVGLDVDLIKRDYFLESTSGYATNFAPTKLQALERLARLTYDENPRLTTLSEAELVVPTLRLLDESKHEWMSTTDIIAKLTALFAPQDGDGSKAGDISQTFLSMIAHRNQPSSFIYHGLAHCENASLRISSLGRTTVRALVA